VSPRLEKRLLQAVVPLSAGAAGAIYGPDWLHRGVVGRDLDSHFRYLSGLLLAMGLLFLSCVPNLERKGARMRLLAVMPVIGGLARLFALLQGPPSRSHVVALFIELGVVPLLTLWQARLARRFTQR
jgi:hypothetical protein